LGEYTKPEVREMALKFELPIAERPDSQDLCFLGSGTAGDFLERNAPDIRRPGPILSYNGEAMGQHRGLAFYTIGQRSGLGISAPHPLYVIHKDIENNALIVGPKESLGRSQLIARSVNWIAGTPPERSLRAQIKIRYQAKLAWGLVTPLAGDSVNIEFDEPLRDITPGQAAVIYDGEVCLGGGVIESNQIIR